MGAADLFFDLALVVEEGMQSLIEIFFDKIFDEAVIHANEAEEERNRERIELGGVELEDNLGKELGGDVGAAPGIDDADVIALLDQIADFFQGEMPAVGGIVVSAIRVLLDLEAFGIGFGLRRHALI